MLGDSMCGMWCEVGHDSAMHDGLLVGLTLHLPRLTRHPPCRVRHRVGGCCHPLPPTVVLALPTSPPHSPPHLVVCRSVGLSSTAKRLVNPVSCQ